MEGAMLKFSAYYLLGAISQITITMMIYITVYTGTVPCSEKFNVKTWVILSTYVSTIVSF